jgi:hypothetical protein
MVEAIAPAPVNATNTRLKKKIRGPRSEHTNLRTSRTGAINIRGKTPELSFRDFELFTTKVDTRPGH